MGGSLDLGTSLEVDPVFLVVSNSLRPLPPPPPRSKAISSFSSLDYLFGWVTTRIGAWKRECLSNSPSVSKMGITYAS